MEGNEQEIKENYSIKQIPKKKHQSAITIPEQIDNLKCLGLIVEDESKAKTFLNSISYYRFIKAYSLKLKHKNGKYHDGITFNQLAELYLFNSKLRQLLFPQIERVEISLRCHISNYFCLKYGIFGYLEPNNFKRYPLEFKKELQETIKRNRRNPFVHNFQTTYENKNVPFYAFVELMSFGTLSKFFKNMKNADKKEVCTEYGVTYTYFESWVENISYVRNVCAHYGRIYNAKFSKKAKLYPIYSKRGIKNDQIMGTLICMKYLLANDSHWIEFVNAIELLLDKCKNVHISSLGFPVDWKDVLIES